MGHAKAGQNDVLRAAVDDELVPALRALPGVRDVKALWPQRREDDPPEIYCQVIVAFDDRDGLDHMLLSAERRATRPLVLDLVERFDGTISHIDFAVGQETERRG